MNLHSLCSCLSSEQREETGLLIPGYPLRVVHSEEVLSPPWTSVSPSQEGAGWTGWSQEAFPTQTSCEVDMSPREPSGPQRRLLAALSLVAQR